MEGSFSLTTPASTLTIPKMVAAAAAAVYPLVCVQTYETKHLLLTPFCPVIDTAAENPTLCMILTIEAPLLPLLLQQPC